MDYFYYWKFSRDGCCGVPIPTNNNLGVECCSRRGVVLFITAPSIFYSLRTYLTLLYAVPYSTAEPHCRYYTIRELFYKNSP